MHVSLLCSSTLHDDQQLHTCIANHEPVIITSYWYFHNHPLNNVQCVCVWRKCWNRLVMWKQVLWILADVYTLSDLYIVLIFYLQAVLLAAT